MHPRVAMFLRERDRARVRGDLGVIRSLTADLRRLGVPDDATLAHPAGLPTSRRAASGDGPKRTRQAKPRCEHGSVPDRCPECNPEALAS